MRVTARGMELVAARVGKGSAEALVRMTRDEQNAADLETQRAILVALKEEIFGTHPVHRGPLNEQLTETRARVRHLAAAVRRYNQKQLRDPNSSTAPPAPDAEL